MIAFLASTYASVSSIGFEDVFGFGLAAIAIVGGIAFYLLMRKNAV
ncbi:hypothetical protein L3N51_02385 [Metallosphaera sp. J1]|nr:hypothetical protein [Metallosphaera javensis (ex Hofmann et al. 2022)]MCG3110088.1 hypothetical protein [Metallosphaera javensis (ex Hofmann et al. 2022)]